MDARMSAALDDTLTFNYRLAGSEGPGGALQNVGTVYINPPPNATAAQISQVQAYVNGANQALAADTLSPVGRVSTLGELREAASDAASAERARAAAAGTPYQGHAGHVPDTTWTGTPDPFTWLDLEPRVNLSIGGQANRYPIGYVPLEFRVGPGPK
jgi:toxin YxiD